MTLFNFFQTFIELGVSSAFDPKLGDFSGINGGRDLSLSSMIQVNDFNILSHDFAPAAVQEAVIETESRFSINFERQFLYMVRHNPTGLILTIGRYNQPADSNEDHHQHHEHHEDHDHDHENEHESS
jgi:serine protease inhibitor